MLAKYKCMKCKHEWEEKPGPVSCPKCGYFENIDWLNYQQMRDSGELDEKR